MMRLNFRLWEPLASGILYINERIDELFDKHLKSFEICEQCLEHVVYNIGTCHINVRII